MSISQERKLEPTDEVMLLKGHRDDRSFNPYYGLVVQDLFNLDPAQHRVLVLWEDGIERMHFRSELMAWADAPLELRKP